VLSETMYTIPQFPNSIIRKTRAYAVRNKVIQKSASLQQCYILCHVSVTFDINSCTYLLYLTSKVI